MSIKLPQRHKITRDNINHLRYILPYAFHDPDKTTVLYLFERCSHAEGEYHLFCAVCNAGRSDG